MRRIDVFAWGLVALVLLSCCDGASRRYRVKGVVGDSSFDGEMAYIRSLCGEDLDSAVVENGLFSMVGLTDSATIAEIRVDGMRSTFILESGNINMEVHVYEYIDVFGTTLNDQISQFRKKADQAQSIYLEELADVSDEARDKLTNTFVEETEALFMTTLEVNRDNIAGVLLFSDVNLYVKKDASMGKCYEIVGEKVKSHPMVAKSIDISKRLWESTVGRPFKDINGVDAADNQTSLSAYFNKGNHVLLVFWASWCRPCLEEIPHLKVIHDTYKDKNLQLVGVAVKDELAKSIKSIESEGIIWPQILDTGSAPYDLYGVFSIPSLILFDPSGVILKRDFYEGELDQYLQELLSDI